MRIHIVESNPTFAESNVIQALDAPQQPTAIYLDHVDEFHYVSTLPCNFGSSPPQKQHTSLEILEENATLCENNA